MDLNADLGEEVTDDAGLLAVVTSANVACGFHAGTPATMRAVCAEAVRRGVAVGAQVSYADRAELRPGRPRRGRPTCCASRWPNRSAMLARIAETEGARVALPQAARRALPPRRGRRGAGRRGARRVGRPAGARDAGLPAARPGGGAGAGRALEGFPDRGYTDGGRLLPRDAPGRWSPTPRAVAARAVRAGRRRSTRSACTATRRAPSRPRSPYAGRSRQRGWTSSRAGRDGGANLCRNHALPVEHGTTSVGNPVGPEVCRRNPCGGIAGRHRTLPTGTASAGPGIGSDEQLHPATCSPRRPGDGDCGSWDAGAMARTSPSRANRGAPDAHTIWSPSPYLRLKCARSRAAAHVRPVNNGRREDPPRR